MRRIERILLTGLLVMLATPFAANADVSIAVSPDNGTVNTGSVTLTLSLFLTTDIGTSTDDSSWSIGCNSNCAIHTFVFNEAYAPGSGLVNWGGYIAPPEYSGLPNLNTSGSITGSGDGQGTVVGDGSYVGTIGFTHPSGMNGDGGTYLIGTLTVHILGPTLGNPALVTPYFRSGEGVFDSSNPGVPIPTTLQPATIGVLPEPTTASLLALGLAGLALRARHARQ